MFCWTHLYLCRHALGKDAVSLEESQSRRIIAFWAFSFSLYSFFGAFKEHMAGELGCILSGIGLKAWGLAHADLSDRRLERA